MAACIFCGDYAGAQIQVPYGYLPGIGDRVPGAELPVVLPCCAECKEVLDDVAIGSLEGAARYLGSVYREVYTHLLADFKWTREELEELGHSLRSTIELSHRAHLETKERVERCDRVAVLGPELSEDLLDDIEYSVRLRLPKTDAGSGNVTEQHDRRPGHPLPASDGVAGDTGGTGEAAHTTTAVPEAEVRGAADASIAGQAAPLAGAAARRSGTSEDAAAGNAATPGAQRTPEASAPDRRDGMRDPLGDCSGGPAAHVVTVSDHWSAEIDQLHGMLSERMRSLRSARDGLPVFCLEHGLDPDGRARVVSLAGAAVRSFGISRWWRGRYLPLLIAAAETGYTYLGTGTDFWPKFAAALGAEISTHDREVLSSLFEAGHREHGIPRPVTTPWNRAFRHIAWPISNAIAPMEIHRPLAAALLELFRNRPEEPDDAMLVEGLRAVARTGGSSRLIEWLEDAHLAAAVSRRLLGLPDDLRRIAPDTLDRVLADLRSDRLARLDVERAVALHSARGSSGGARLPSFGKCMLRLGEGPSGDLVLSLVAPPLPGDAKEQLKKALAARGLKLTLWDGTDPVDAGQFLSGLPVPLAFGQLPPPGAAFLPGIGESAVGGSLAKRLVDMAPAISPPLLFRLTAGAAAEQTGDTTFRAAGVYRVLTGHMPETGVAGIRFVGPIAGLNCIEVDARIPAAREWMARRGFHTAEQPTVEVLGGLPLGSGPKGPVFAAGMPVMLVPRFTGAAAWPIRVRQPGAGPSELLDADRPVAVVDAEVGDHVLLLEGAGWKEEIFFSVADPEPPGDVLSIEAEPPEPTVESLVRGELAFRLHSPLPVEAVEATLTLSLAGTELARADDVLPRLPAVVGSGSALLRRLSSAADWRTVPRSAAVEMVLSLGGMCRGRWTLGRELALCSWEESGKRWTASNEAGPLIVAAVPAESPLSAPVREEDAESVGYRLLLPEIEGHTDASSAICVGPRAGTLHASAPTPPKRLLRQPDSRGDALGLIPCLEALLRWAAAAAAHPLADHRRRTVVASLEAAAVEQLCGAVWARAEAGLAPLSGDRWAAFIPVCMERSLACGGSLPAVDAGDQARLQARLESLMRRAIPDLWETDPAVCGGEDLAKALDTAVIQAYEGLREALLAEGREAFDDPDTGHDADAWREGIAETRNRHEMAPLVSLLLPSARAEVLRAPDYTALAAADVATLLEESHVDLQRRGTTRWLSDSDIRVAFALWTDPRSVLRNPGWREATVRLLADRQTARAARYAALRFRASRIFPFVSPDNDA